MYDIAVIGLGATGVSLLSQIQDEIYKVRLVRPGIVVFNPSESFAKGKAFGDADIVHKVNTPPAMMSTSFMAPEKFRHWLDSMLFSADKFPSRLTYSNFIQHAYREIKQMGVLHLEEFRQNVISIKKNSSGFTITDDGGNTIDAGKVIMCLGALSADVFPALKNQPNFISHYTQYNRTFEGNLLIAGSSLTAIDAFRYARGLNKPYIHFYSRSGYAPTCLTEQNIYTPVHLTWQNIMAESAYSDDSLKIFARLLHKEFQLLRAKGEFRPAMKLLRTGKQSEYFRLLITRSQSGDLPWQDVLVSTRPYMHKLWNSFSVLQKQKFLKMYGAVWAAWRHPVPHEVFAELTQASEEGKVKFHQALSLPVKKGNQFIIKTKNGVLSCDYLWDATGGKSNITDIKKPLLQNMMREQLIEAHPCGGINIDPLTFQCRVKGENITGLYNIGPLSRGTLFSTNAFWFNARCAESWVKQWIFELNKNEIKEVF